MGERAFLPDDLISIGELSELYSISKRALRLYHEMGLLIPEKIDENTGYRYYTQSQKSRLDMILQMKSSGLSLKQIKQLLETDDISVFEATLGEVVEELDRKIAEYKSRQDALKRKIDSFRYIRNPPPLDTVFVEYIPKRMALLMDIEAYDLKGVYPEGSPWKKALQRVKDIFLENQIPMALYHQVSGRISQDSLKRGRMIYDSAFVIIKDYMECLLPVSYLQSGAYVCLYNRYISMDHEADAQGIQMLLDYVKENHYQIMGPYLAEVIMEASYLMENNRMILVKQQIPVKQISEA